MVGCSMWYILQMVTMVVLSWRLIMMGRLHIQNTMDMGAMGAYDEKPDPFHFEYGVHDDKYYTDFSEVRSGDE